MMHPRRFLAPAAAAFRRATLPVTLAFIRLSPRERRLALLTGSVVFLLGSYFVLSSLLNTRRELTTTLSGKRLAAGNAAILLAEAPRWRQLEVWRREHQPRLSISPQLAGGQLLTQVRGLAASSGVSTEAEQILPPETVAPGQGVSPGAAARPYQPIAVNLVAKGSWPAVVKFLAALQGNPEAFLVLEACTLRTEPNDANTMRGELRVAKWYAPAGS